MMVREPVIQTDRLILRPFTPSDAPRFAELAGSRDVSDTMISVPHPFTLQMALETVRRYQMESANGSSVHFAVCEISSPGQLVGYTAIHHIDREHLEGELSFWIDGSSSGKGFAVEAATAAVNFAFDGLGLNRICAFHMVRNERSKRVLVRIGMQQEGLLRQRVRKNGVFEDVLIWAILRDSRR